MNEMEMRTAIAMVNQSMRKPGRGVVLYLYPGDHYAELFFVDGQGVYVTEKSTSGWFVLTPLNHSKFFRKEWEYAYFMIGVGAWKSEKATKAQRCALKDMLRLELGHINNPPTPRKATLDTLASRGWVDANGLTEHGRIIAWCFIHDSNFPVVSK